MVLAANDVADAQVGIVGARREMVGRHAVAAKKREVFDIVGRFLLLAVHGVYKAHLAAGAARHAIAQGKRLARRGSAIALGR